MFGFRFPYTNFHELNLDWIIGVIKRAVFSINGITPDSNGNVQVNGADLGAVVSVDGVSPDSLGNVDLRAVKTVNGISPDSAGNVLAGTVRSVNGKSPGSIPTPGSITLNALDVGAVKTVNSLNPDASGNVNVGTVKSVDGYGPDADGKVKIGSYGAVRSVNSTFPDPVTGNVNLPTVAGVTSVDGIGPDGNGDVPLGAVTEINSITPVSGVVTLTSGDVGALSKTMVTPTYTINDTFADPDHRYVDIRSIGGFLYIRFDITLISALAYGDVLISGMPATAGQLTVKAWAGSTPYNINLSSDSSLKGNSSIPSGTTIVGWAVKPLSNPS